MLNYKIPTHIQHITRHAPVQRARMHMCP